MAGKNQALKPMTPKRPSKLLDNNPSTDMLRGKGPAGGSIPSNSGIKNFLRGVSPRPGK